MPERAEGKGSARAGAAGRGQLSCCFPNAGASAENDPCWHALLIGR